jgi:hypothetical protein
MLNRIILIILITLIGVNCYAQSGSFSITWDAGTEDNLDQYRIYRSTSPGASTLIGSVAATENNYRDNTITRGVRYYYRVRVMNSEQMLSGYSSEVSAAIPLISGMSSQMGLIPGSALNILLDPLVNDPDDADNQLVWSVSGQSQLLATIVNRVATISAPLTWSGQEVLTFRVQDPDGFYDRVIVTINAVIFQPPQFSTIPAQQINEDAQGSINLFDYVTDIDSDNSDLSFTAGNVSNINIQINNGVLTYRPAANWFGARNVTVTVTDESGGSDQTSFQINVSSVNDPPQFSTIPAQQINEDSQGSLNLLDYVTDVDSDDSELTFGAGNVNNINIQINNNILTYTPAANWFGSRNVSVTVTDEIGASSQASIQINVSGVNDPPQITQLPELIIYNDTLVTLNMNNYVTDIDHPVPGLTWSFNNFNQLSVVFNDATDMLTIDATGTQPGFEQIVVTVSDTELSDTDTINVLIRERDTWSPVISDFPSVSFAEDSSTQLSLNNYISDEDTPVDNLIWSISQNQNILVTINQSVKVIRFSARQNWNGQENFWLRVTDPDQNRDSVQIQVTVNPVNDSPVISTLPLLNLSGQTSSQIDLKLYTIDIEDPVESLTWTASPSQNVSCQISEDGMASFSVLTSWHGQERVSIFAFDSENGSDTSEVIVFRQDLTTSPVFSGLQPITFEEDGQFSLNLGDFLSDPDNSLDQLQIIFENNTFIDISIDPSHVVTFIPDGNWHGTENVLIEALDPDGNTTFGQIRIDVQSVNDQPFIFPVGNRTIVSNTILSLDLREYVTDVDGEDDIENISIISSGNSFIGHYLDFLNMQVMFFAPSGYEGADTYLLSVRDREGAENTTIFRINVIESNIAGSIVIDYFGSQTNLSMTWNTKKETRDFIQYGTDTQYGFSSEQDPNYGKEHSHLLTGLEENQQYHFRVVSQSENGVVYSADSIFTTGSNPGDEVNVFPVPYVQSKDLNNSGIFFANLPFNGKIIIFNFLGEPVFKQENVTPNYRWLVENDAGKKVASGLYLYVVNNENDKKVTSGKIIVVR